MLVQFSTSILGQQLITTEHSLRSSDAKLSDSRHPEFWFNLALASMDKTTTGHTTTKKH